MGLLGLLAVGVGLSMDAFAVAICKGLAMRRINWLHAVTVAFFFGFFQAAMPFAGWLLGSQFERYITPVDHWIAFGLLAFIGGKMLWDALHEANEETCDCDALEGGLDLRELALMAIATSIDALAVGITFAFLGVNIFAAMIVIGATTFVLSFVGVVVGNQFGSRFEKPATITGGIVLILIGAKILVEHLGLLGI